MRKVEKVNGDSIKYDNAVIAMPKKQSENSAKTNSIFDNKNVSSALKTAGICGLILGGIAIADLVAFKGRHIKHLCIGTE